MGDVNIWHELLIKMAPVFKGKSVQAWMYSESIATENQQYITANKFNISLFLAEKQKYIYMC